MADSPAPPARLSAAQLAAIAQELDAFVNAIPGVRTAVIASVDGFALAEASGRTGNGERLAAMTSSMLGLARAVTAELTLGAMEVLMVEAAEGKVLMLSIPVPSRPLLLMAACSQRTVIGGVLWSARECSQRILAACAAA